MFKFTVLSIIVGAVLLAAGAVGFVAFTGSDKQVVTRAGRSVVAVWDDICGIASDRDARTDTAGDITTKSNETVVNTNIAGNDLASNQNNTRSGDVGHSGAPSSTAPSKVGVKVEASNPELFEKATQTVESLKTATNHRAAEAAILMGAKETFESGAVEARNIKNLAAQKATELNAARKDAALVANLHDKAATEAGKAFVQYSKESEQKNAALEQLEDEVEMVSATSGTMDLVPLPSPTPVIGDVTDGDTQFSWIPGITVGTVAIIGAAALLWIKFMSRRESSGFRLDLVTNQGDAAFNSNFAINDTGTFIHVDPKDAVPMWTTSSASSDVLALGMGNDSNPLVASPGMGWTLDGKCVEKGMPFYTGSKFTHSNGVTLCVTNVSELDVASFSSRSPLVA